MNRNTPLVPRLAGPWRHLVSPPALERHASPRAQAVDFTLLQADDARWHLVACVRGTSAPGSGRLTYRWSSDDLIGAPWTAMGIFRESDPTMGHEPHHLQAPFCVSDGGRWWMFCNSRGAHCLTGANGIDFAWTRNRAGSWTFFDMGRDLQILDNRQVDGLWYAYYTDPGAADPLRHQHTVSCRTCPTLDGVWSPPVDVGVLGGAPRDPLYDFCEAESPFVIRRDGWYYRFQHLDVFASRSPTDWTGAVCTVLAPGRRRLLAPEIVVDGERTWIAAYGYDDGLNGIYIAPLAWC
ncbi:MAG: hypothetical protein J0M02_14590 [Planctomycetes bacterium]|nr:hypothetical protein [Planctomycetota bacterium]